MSRFMKRFFVSSFALLLVIPTLAQAVAIGPTLFDFSADPGQSIEAGLTIRNDEAQPRTYFLQLQKFIPKGENGQQEFLPLRDTSGLPSWIFLSMPAVTLNPGQSIEVPFSIRIPQGTPSGSYYAALFATGLSENTGSNSGTGLTARVGALIFLTVQGTLTEKVRFMDFQRTSDGVLSHLPVGFVVALRNEGNTYVTPVGTVEIKNLLVGKPHQATLNTERGKILPASTRRVLAEWTRRTPKEASGFFHEVREEWSNFGLGLYRAQLKLEMRGLTGEAPTLYFWVLPWRLCLLGALLLTTLAIGAGVGRKWWISRQL